MCVTRDTEDHSVIARNYHLVSKQCDLSPVLSILQVVERFDKNLTSSLSLPDPCLSSLCLNNGTCIKLARTSYRCSCLPGFKGRCCSNKKNPCQYPNPCLNGGICSQTTRDHPNQWHAYTCECLPGFTGELCEDTDSAP